MGLQFGKIPAKLAKHPEEGPLEEGPLEEGPLEEGPLEEGSSVERMVAAHGSRKNVAPSSKRPRRLAI